MYKFENRYVYLDILRALAIIFILFWHVSNQFATNLTNWKVAISVLSLARIGIPLFLMISGALLLKNKYVDIGEFFKKRFKRIFTPHICWVIIYFALGLTLVTDLYGLYAYDTPASFCIEYFVSIFFSFSDFSSIFWFIWCIIGFYLTVPILNSFIKDHELKGVEYVLIIAIAFALIPTLGLDKSNIADRFKFAEPAFLLCLYPLLGYYLHKKEFNIKNKYMAIIGLALFILGYLLSLSSMYILGRPDISIQYLNINHLFIIIESAGLFLLFKYLNTGIIFDKFHILLKMILSLSICSFGMYFVHFVLLKLIPAEFLTQFLVGKACIWIPVFGVTLVFLSWIIILIMSKIPVIKWLSAT